MSGERYYDQRFPVSMDYCILKGGLVMLCKFQIIYGIIYILINYKFDTVYDLTELTPEEIRFISDKAVTYFNNRSPLTEIGKPLELFRQTNEPHIMSNVDIDHLKNGHTQHIKNKAHPRDNYTFYTYRTGDSNNYIIKFKSVGKDGNDGLSSFTCIAGPFSDDELFSNLFRNMS